MCSLQGKPQERNLQVCLLNVVTRAHVWMGAQSSLPQGPVDTWLLFTLVPSGLFWKQQGLAWVSSRQCGVSETSMSPPSLDLSSPFRFSCLGSGTQGLLELPVWGPVTIPVSPAAARGKGAPITPGDPVVPGALPSSSGHHTLGQN